MTEPTETDKIVGEIAGIIYTDISSRFPYPPLMLLPGITFKVKKIYANVPDPFSLSKNEQKWVAKNIQTSIIPMLSSYDIEPALIKQITPIIESAAEKALAQIGNKKDAYEN
jgi:hypothetical protein